jgi:hypothetical protein
VRRSEIHEIQTSRRWLAEVDPALVAALIGAGRIISLRNGETIFRPKDSPGGMCGVVAGAILLSTFGREGTPLPGHVARRSHRFGYGSVLDRQRRWRRDVVSRSSVRRSVFFRDCVWIGLLTGLYVPVQGGRWYKE